MNRKNLILIVFQISISFLFLMGGNAYGQFFGTKRDKADKEYERTNYIVALKMYQELVDQNLDRSIDVHRRIGDCYFKTQQNALAEKFYKKVCKSRRASAEDYLTYSQILKINGKEKESKKYLKKHLKKAKSKGEDDSIEKLRKALAKANQKKNKISVNNLSINTAKSEFAPVVYNSQLVFVTNYHEEHQHNFLYRYNNFPFYELKKVKLDYHHHFPKGDPKLFSKDISSTYNEGPSCFSITTREFYFTRNSMDQEIGVKGKDHYAHLMIYKAEKHINHWVNITKLSFNNTEYSCAHPTISADGKKLIFASDMPGGFGGMDLYLCNRMGKDWSDPINLGPTINTAGNECFPFFHNTGIIYFASNGHPGFGGLDLFAANTDDFNEFIITNIGEPINSEWDDFGIYLNKTSTSGFFSSNRLGGKGNDDIYNMIMEKPMLFNTKIIITLKNKYSNELISSGKVLFIKGNKKVDTLVTKMNGRVKRSLATNCLATIKAFPKFYEADSISFEVEGDQMEKTLYLEPYYILQGQAVNEKTGKPITNARVEIRGEQIIIPATDSTGNFKVKLRAGIEYDFVFSGIGYMPTSHILDTKYRKPGIIKTEFSVTPIEEGETFTMKNILYALNAYKVPESAYEELNRVVKFLNDNPDVNIELSSHTDSRGSAAYNQKLSQRRAKAAVGYIIGCGISPSRIIFTGYGETRLKNKCADGVNCSEEEHGENRRTEIKITEVN
ncbi:MAG: OmpA family protein [Bacteroidales bacterium]